MSAFRAATSVRDHHETEPRAGSYASRGGDKLHAAIHALAVDPSGLRALDAGASTGGFTDCLLEHGAREVVAVDVAYGQFDWRLRNDPRVRVLERTNVRSLDPSDAGGSVDLVVADLSFISLATVADAFVAFTPARMLLMVKPQFELPRERVARGGVVREPGAWVEAMTRVAVAYRARSYVLAGAHPSPLTGPKGNREFFLFLSANGVDVGDDALARAAAEAP